MDFIELLTYAPLPLMLIALVTTWKFENSRYFLALLLVVESVDELLYKTSLNWTTHHYLYVMVMNLAFMLPVFFRTNIAHSIYQSTKIGYFKRVSEQNHYALQEIGLMILFFISFILHFVVYIEVWLYKWDVIDVLFIKNSIRPSVQTVLHILMCFALLTYTINTPKREGFYNAKTEN
ncbi:hypothetical protein CWB99_00035 [Pseudoalteromonas rubra]|uniref:Uncharacterized protein n=1 Tax=Pseudoalteromonas rubra TaxID=43658 RepID=A0A5S3WTY4_9GAMM|nr:hypothetical protein [Pseudoalteromonas rubra]TMP31839.1 hypothetical protein CWC00_14600 [Pseudoalteromonas rubra]TMP33078.1 hypothetical protein CWB99_00035 [Pseudoalteromonas rubra]